jgi:uncharacterized integral membrane protein
MRESLLKQASRHEGGCRLAEVSRCAGMLELIFVGLFLAVIYLLAILIKEAIVQREFPAFGIIGFTVVAALLFTLCLM